MKLFARISSFSGILIFIIFGLSSLSSSTSAAILNDLTLVAGVFQDEASDSDILLKEAVLEKANSSGSILPNCQTGYQIGEVQTLDEWALITIVCWPIEQLDPHVLVPSIILFAVGHKVDINGVIEWDISIEGDSDFTDTVGAAPEQLIDSETKSYLKHDRDQGLSTQSVNATYTTGLPWQPGATWYYRTSIHGSLNQALDFASPGGSPGDVMAADDGRVIWAYETCMLIERPGGLQIGYQHIDRNDISKWKASNSVKKGQFLGKTTRASGCSGNTYAHHVHFWLEKINPNGSTFGGWTLHNPALRKGNEERRANLSFVPTAAIQYDGSVPVANQVRVKVNIPGRTTSSLDLRVYDGGVLVRNLKVNVTSGQLSGSINLGSLNSGNYWIVVRTANHSLTKARLELLSGGTKDIDFGNLIGGDYSGDDKINLPDFQIFAQHYYISKNPGPHPLLNLAGNNTYLEIEDFQYFAQNYQKEGEGLPHGFIFESGATTKTHDLETNNIEEPNAEVSLYLSPMLAQYSASQEFDVAISYTGAGDLVDGADISLLYDSCSLQFVRFTKGSLFAEGMSIIDRPDVGVLDIGVSKSVAGSGTSNQGTIGTVRFKALYGSTSAYMRILHSPGVTVDSNIVNSNTGADVLTHGGEALYTLVGGTSRPSVSGIVSPESGSYFNQSIIPLSVEVDDGCGRTLARSVKFEAFYNGSWKQLGFDRNGSDGWSFEWNTSGISDQVASIRAQIYGLDSSFDSFTQSNITIDKQSPSIPTLYLPTEFAPDGTLQLDWSDASDNLSGISFYGFEYKQGINGSWSDPFTGITSNSYELDGLAVGHDYYFRMWATDKAGNVSGYSETKLVRSPDLTKPSVTWLAPIEARDYFEAYGETVTLKVDATDNRGVTKVQFDWWDDVAQKRVLIGEDHSAPFEINFNSNLLQPDCHIVNAGAFDAAGNFKEDYIFVCLNPPPAPTLYSISNSEDNDAYTVTWSSVTGASGYVLQEKYKSGDWQPLPSTSGTNRSFTGKTAGDWCYRVQSQNNAGSGFWSTTQCTTVASPNTFTWTPTAIFTATRTPTAIFTMTRTPTVVATSTIQTTPTAGPSTTPTRTPIVSPSITPTSEFVSTHQLYLPISLRD